MGLMEQNAVELPAVWVFDLKDQTGNWNITPDNDRAYKFQFPISNRSNRTS